MKNKKKSRAFLSAVTALSLLAVSMPAVSVNAVDDAVTTFPFTIEGENMDDVDQVWTSIYENQIPDYSGEGFAYITGNPISCTVTVPEDGMYTITVRGAQILDKEQGRTETIAVNGNEISKVIPYADKWTDFSFGNVRLNKGENKIEVLNKYGYIAVDSLTVSVAEKHDYSLATGETCDPDATPETKSLMKYLKSVYGKHVIAGQQEIYGGGHQGNYEWENEYIENLTGKVPAIRGLDFMNYNPLYGWDDGSTERAIAWVKERGGIITASWHINVPIDFENYEIGDELDWQKCTYKNYQASNGNFNTENVLKEGTKEREYFELAMEDLAEQLTKLQDANVPIIFRPLHEAQGNDGLYGDGTAWFWWGDRGAEVYKGLWKLLYTTLTEKYDLHNIIWEFNSYDYESSPDWYPGDDMVDIVAYDKYNVENNRGDGKSSGPNLIAISGKFDSLYNLTDGGKMVSMAENDTIPATDNMIVEDAYWLYVCPWYDGGEDGGTAFLGDAYQDKDEFTKFYQSDLCITLDELPEDLYNFSGDSSEDEKPEKTTTGTENTTTSDGETETKTTASVSSTDSGDTPDAGNGDANGDGKTTIADCVSILQFLASSDEYALDDEAMSKADCYNVGDGINTDDALAIQKLDAGLIDSLPYNP